MRLILFMSTRRLHVSLQSHSPSSALPRARRRLRRDASFIRARAAEQDREPIGGGSSGTPGRIRTDNLRLIWATVYKTAALPLSYRSMPLVESGARYGWNPVGRLQHEAHLLKQVAAGREERLTPSSKIANVAMLSRPCATADRCDQWDSDRLEPRRLRQVAIVSTQRRLRAARAIGRAKKRSSRAWPESGRRTHALATLARSSSTV